MSDYPGTPSYGPNYSGAQDQPNPPYLPPSYPAQYIQPEDSHMGHGNMSAGYDASMMGYGYNGATSSFSTASAISTGVPPPIFQGWNQDPTPLPPFTLQNGQNYMGYPDHSQHHNQYYPPQVQPAYQPNIQPAKPYDEGEVSEGEFDPKGAKGNNIASGYPTDQYGTSNGNGYGEHARHSNYSGPLAQSSHQPFRSVKNYVVPRDPPQTRPLQPDVYSPYASSKVDDYTDQTRANKNYKAFAQNNARIQAVDGSGETNGRIQNGGTKKPEALSCTNANGTTSGAEKAKQQAAHTPIPKSSTSQVSISTTGKSVADARKKAQAAILNLWPYDVRFQTYLDEGFKEEVVGSLFDNLQMPRGPIKSGSSGQGSGKNDTSSTAVQDGQRRVVSSAPNGSAAVPSQSRSVSHQQLPSLSMQVNGKHATTHGSGSVISNLPSPSVSNITTKPAVMTEKERTLQSKMEALRKSREERAQKAAAKSSAKSPTDTGPAPHVQPAAPVREQEASQPSADPILKPSEPSLPPSRPLTQPPTSLKVVPSESPKPKITTQPSAPVIPGLFLTSTVSSPISTSNLQNVAPALANAQTNFRKRPVAADFDQPTPTIAPYKRPFGQSRIDKPLVIDVSEDESDDDEDVAMDLDSQVDQESPLQSARKMSDQRLAAVNNIPPLSDFSSNKTFTPPPNNSTVGTPPMLQSTSKGSSGRPEVLIRKESEIEQLKKRIAEAEARRNRKTPSGAQTPRAVETQNFEEKDRSGNIASKVEASVKIQHLIETAEDTASSDQRKLAEMQAAEIVKAAELKKNEEETERMRLQRLTLEVDAEFFLKRTKLEQLKAESVKLEAEIQKNMESKRRMTEEMERLGQEVEVQKERLQDLTINDANGDNIDEPLPIPVVLKNTENETKDPTPPVVGTPEQLDPVVSAFEKSADHNVELPTQAHNDSVISAPEVNLTPEESIPEPIEQISQQTSTDQALEAALQEAVRAEADSHQHSQNENDNNDNDVEMETSFAPDPDQLEPESPSKPNFSESPAYSPELERTVPDEMDRESDIYEPPEATPPVNAPSPVVSSPFSPAPPDEVPESTIEDEPMEIIEDEPMEIIEDEPMEIIDDSDAQGIVEMLPQQTINVEEPIEHITKQDPNKLQGFTPYESPLKNFRAYRFHPNYKQEVPGGLRSLTYSHRINPDLEFCRYELAGGICNDPTCESQHFKDIGLPDDAVLTNLGSPDQFNATQREEFCEGLRGVLFNLRARKIKDFDRIASEIIAHRAKFLGDDSKVLNLEGTNI